MRSAPFDQHGTFAQLTGQVTDKGGNPLEDREKPLAHQQIRKGVDVRHAGDAYLTATARQRTGDMLWYDVRTNPALSLRAVETLEKNAVKLGESIYKWPLHLLDKKSGATLKECCILWALKRHPVLDMTRATVKYYSQTEVVRDVLCWAFDPDLIPEADIIPTSYRVTLCTQRVVDVVGQHGLTGFAFTPIDVAR